jgi:trans-aconitate methyltransferase
MKRTPEPELMDEPSQASAYASADFEDAHSQFTTLFGHVFPNEAVTGRVLDLGCGPGDVTLRFARAYPESTVHGVDGAQAMLDAARPVLDAAPPDVRNRVRLFYGLLPDIEPPHDTYDAVISNSLLHHLHDPGVLWRAVQRYACDGALVFVMDLRRPPSPAAVDALVAKHAEGEPEVLRRDFRHSLHAAFRPDEVRRQLREAGLHHFSVRAIGDRHLIAYGRMS